MNKLKKLISTRSYTIKQFPLTHFILLFITTIVVFEILDDVDNYAEICAASSFTLLLSLYTPINNILKWNSWNKKLNRASTIISLLLWVWYFFIILNKDIYYTDEELLYYWIIQIIVIWLLLLTFLATNKDELKSIYSINKFFTAWFFWVLAGLIVRWWISSILWSIEILFDIDIRRRRYEALLSICMIILNGSFWLNYYTDQMNSYEKNKDEKHSRIKRIFWNYIYLPLCLLYWIIILCFCVKSLFLSTRPKDYILIFVWFWYFLLWLSSTYLTYFEDSITLKRIHKYLYWSFIAVWIFMLFNCIHDAQMNWLHLWTYFMFSGIFIIIITSILALFTKKRLLSFVSVLLWISFFSIYFYPFNAVTVSRNAQINKLKYLITNYQEWVSLPLKKTSLKNCTKHCDEIQKIIKDLSKNFEYKSRSNWIITWYNNSYHSYRYDLEDYLFTSNYKTPIQEEYFNFNHERNQRIDVHTYVKIKELNKYNSNWLKKIDIDWLNFDISTYKKTLYESSKNKEKEYIFLRFWNYDLIFNTINWYITKWQETDENDINEDDITITNLEWRIAEKA